MKKVKKKRKGKEEIYKKAKEEKSRKKHIGKEKRNGKSKKGEKGRRRKLSEAHNMVAKPMVIKMKDELEGSLLMRNRFKKMK